MVQRMELAERTAGLSLHSDSNPLDRVVYGIPVSRRERAAAFRLVHDAYSRSGLMQPNAHRMRVTSHHILPKTAIFNATHDGRVIYTMSMVGNGELGLPADTLYARELHRRRRQWLRLAEVTCLASRQEYFGRSGMLRVFVGLVSLMFQYARHNGVQRLIIVVHPRQQAFYERMLGFRQFGEHQSCPWVCDRPAVGMEHDFERCDRIRYRLYDQIYNRRFQPWELTPRPMPPSDRHFFAAAVESLAVPYPLAG
jgi:hypothetical protein